MLFQLRDIDNDDVYAFSYLGKIDDVDDFDAEGIVMAVVQEWVDSGESQAVKDFGSVSISQAFYEIPDDFWEQHDLKPHYFRTWSFSGDDVLTPS